MHMPPGLCYSSFHLSYYRNDLGFTNWSVPASNSIGLALGRLSMQIRRMGPRTLWT